MLRSVPPDRATRAAGLHCRLHAVTFAGHHATCEQGMLGVPRKELVSTQRVSLQGGRLAVARAPAEAATLVKEPEAFRVKVTPAASEAFGAWREGQCDGLVLAVALAYWVGEVRGLLAPPRIEGPLVWN